MCVFFISLGFSIDVYAIGPYENYSYSNKLSQAEPQAYLPIKVITGKSLGTIGMKNPEDVCVSPDSSKIYISDTGNNRILVLNNQYELIKIIDKIHNISNDYINTFNNPSGLFVARNGNLYICDTDNKRVVVLDNNWNFIKQYTKPNTFLLSKEYQFKPVKVAVDFSYRLFIVEANENKGIIELEKNGEFIAFFGAVKTQPGIIDALFKLISTKSQREKMTKLVPTKYSNITIDKDGFVFGTVGAVSTDDGYNPEIFVRKLNYLGNDILKRTASPIMGDLEVDVDKVGKPVLSNLCDIVALNDGIYSVLGQQYGRVYTYDDNGNLLYIFGGIGQELGQFGIPVALDVIDENKYLVLDFKYNHLVLYEPTEYAKLVIQGIVQYHSRQFKDSEQTWKDVLNYTAKSNLAYNSMGESLLRNKKYKDAMEYFYRCNNTDLYSIAYKYYRKDLMNRYFNKFMTVLVIVIVIAIIAKKLIKYIKKKRVNLFE